MLATVMMVAGISSAFAVGETMTAKTVEGVTMHFEVTKDNPKECMVTPYHDSDGFWSSPCIDQNTTGKVTIPETVMGYTVTSIDNYAFHKCSKVEEVVIPSAVNYMANGVFHSCSSLKKCWLPESLVKLGADGWGENPLFSYCTSLTDVYLPHQLSEIPAMVFYHCESLKHVEIPASVTKIGNQAFAYCSSLKQVSFLGYNCPSFGGNVFLETPTYNYYNGEATGSDVDFIVPTKSVYEYVIPELFESYNFTDPVYVTVGLQNNYYGFNDRSTLGYMVNMQVIEYGSEYACLYWGTLEEVADETFTLPESILGYKVVQLRSMTKDDGSMNNLKKAVIPGTCKSIGENGNYGFSKCKALEEVEIQEGVEKIGYGAFDNTALKELRVPKSLKSYYAAVHNCTKLTDVYFPSFKMETISIPFETSWSGSQATLHVPYGATSNYESIIPKEFAKIEEDEAKNGDIFAYPFKSGNDMMFQIISVKDKTCRTYGENKANKTCIDYTTEGTVNIPKKALDFNVVEVGDFSFGNGYFKGCTKITFVSIPNSVKRIGEFAFCHCDELVSVTIPNTVEEIGGGAFYWDGKLAGVTLPDGLTAIEDAVFSGCSALESITLPEGITKLGYAAFSSSGIASIEIPEGVKEIPNQCFSKCKNLESVVMYDGVGSIGWYGFKDCENLTSIDLPASLASLDYQAFKNCLKLADVKIRNAHLQLVNTYDPSTETNEAFDLKTERYAELTVPKDSYETYNQDPWFLWFNKIGYSLPNIPTGIAGVNTNSSTANKWYTIDGQQLQQAPTKPGLYIQNGKKTIVK